VVGLSRGERRRSADYAGVVGAAPGLGFTTVGVGEWYGRRVLEGPPFIFIHAWRSASTHMPFDNMDDY